MSPTARTQKWHKERGFDIGIVERFNSFSKQRHDLFGFIDMISMRHGIRGVQATSGSNHATRIAKIKAEPRAYRWLREGGSIEVWSWRKLVAYKADGTKAARPRWAGRITEIVLAKDGMKELPTEELAS